MNEENYKELQPGTGLCGGKYIVEKKIGEGGFGITYRAVQTGLNRAVCIKEYFLAGRCVRNTQAKTVQLQGFGALEIKERAPRTIVHPRTGERTVTPGKNQVVFRPTVNIKDELKKL